MHGNNETNNVDSINHTNTAEAGMRDGLVIDVNRPGRSSVKLSSSEAETSSADGEKVEEQNVSEFTSEGDFVFEGRDASAIKADVFMISGCLDSQCSYEIDEEVFESPDRVGGSGSFCTNALLDILSQTETESTTISTLDLLKGLRTKIVRLANGMFTQSPTFSSSKLVDMDKPFSIVPPSCVGSKRAVVVGINYVGTSAPELRACQNDALNFKRYLTKVHGFEEENIALLLDDGKCTIPTKWNIWTALLTMVKASQAGDVCVFYFSGHGSSQTDLGGDESDGRDEYLIPVDWDRVGGGFIVDDDLFEQVIVPLEKGVTFVAFMESCRSGTVLDLPYRFKFHGEDANGHADHVD